MFRIPARWLALFAVFLALAAGTPARAQKSLEPAKPKITLTFWHWWTDLQPFLDEMSERYRLESGVQVNFVLFSPAGQDYWSKVQAAAQANTLPDIIGLTDNPELVARYAKAGKLLEVTADMRDKNHAWEYSFYPRALNALYFPTFNAYGVKPDSYWGAPLTVMNIQLFYNRALFKKAGLNPDRPPKTWAEFLAAVDKLQSRGIPPLLAGFSDLWPAQAFFRAYAWCLLGQDNIRNLYVGDVPYTAPECVRVLKYFTELRDHKAFYPGVVSMPNKEAEILFANGKAAMMINGSWAVNVFDQMNPKLEYGVVPFPKPAEAKYPMVVVGGLGQGAAVTAHARNAKAAVAFLRWLTAPPQQDRWARLPGGFPALLLSQEAMDPKLKPFVNGMNLMPQNLFLDERVEVLEALGKGMQSLLISEGTPESVLADVAKLKKQKPE